MTRRPARRPSRFDAVSDADLQARWRAMTPRFVKWLIVCVVAVPAVWLLNHYGQPGPQWAALLAAAFRIALGGSGLLAFLTVMALVFSRPRHG